MYLILRNIEVLSLDLFLFFSAFSRNWYVGLETRELQYSTMILPQWIRGIKFRNYCFSFYFLFIFNL